MVAAPRLLDEEFRLEALQALHVLDTPPELAFDELAERAREVAGSRTALISFVDDDRQWFKARVGLEAKETHRDIAFCAHAILNDEVMWVEDASKDPRFSDNPLVLGDLHIRFYAGAPIRLSGDERVGTICVIDPEPRAHDAKVCAELKALAEIVRQRLETR